MKDPQGVRNTNINMGDKTGKSGKLVIFRKKKGKI